MTDDAPIDIAALLERGAHLSEVDAETLGYEHGADALALRDGARLVREYVAVATLPNPTTPDGTQYVSEWHTIAIRQFRACEALLAWARGEVTPHA